MTGGKITFKTTVRRLESLMLANIGAFLADIILIMVSIITRKGGTKSMREDTLTENRCIRIGTPIIITIFTKSTKINSSTSTGRVLAPWP